MRGSVLIVCLETLRRSWRGMIMWGGGFALIAAVQGLVLGDVDALRQFADLVATMPPFILQLFGTDNIALLATPEGYLAGRFFSIVSLMFAIYGVIGGMNITAADEDRGILNTVLSAPLRRWQLIAGKFAGYAVLLAGVTLLTFAGAAAGVLSSPVAATFNMTSLLQMTAGIYPLGLVALAFTVLMAGVLPRRGRVTAAGFAFVIGSYFLNFIAAAVGESLLTPLNAVSIFNYYNAPDIVENGLAFGGVALLIGVALVLVGAGSAAFARRDIAV